MNRAHLAAFLWLRWRLAVNQFRRSGTGGVALAGVLTAVIAAAVMLALAIGVGVGLLLRGSSSGRVMMAWDFAIGGFLFFWFVGLMSELQRADALSLNRFLHLPVSATGAFVINYLGSSVSLALVLMLPAMTGLATGLVFSRGLGMLPLFPLMAAFFLMMTALAYQFRGWLAGMMANPRRRRTVMTVVPVLFFLTLQLPNLWNTVGPGGQQRRAERAERQRALSKLNDDLAAGRITRDEYSRRRRAPVERERDENFNSARLVNMVAPPGWLAYGAEAAASGRAWPVVAGVLGMAFIGAISLRRAYGTTIRLYTGDFDRGRRESQPRRRAVSIGPTDAPPRSAWLEARLPWTSEGASGVAMATLRSWTRAPEMKMALLTPVLMLIMASRTFANAGGRAEWMRPLTTAGFAAFVLAIGMAGPIGNQFGHDRAGFRAFVLSPIPRRDLLIGKNLSVFPFALAMMAVVVGLSQWFQPMGVQHLAGVVLQLIPMYLVFCAAGNLLSIVTPVALRPGSAMPAPHQGLRSLGHILFLLTSPLALALTLVPLGVEALFAYMQWFDRTPVYLALSVVQAAAVLPIYRRVVEWEGRLLQRREQTILDVVAVKSE